MRSYGDADLDRISCNQGHNRLSSPALMQTSDRFVLLGNPEAAQVDTAKGYDVEIFRNRVPGGAEAISGNPNVTSGSGSIPNQDYYANAGVMDNQTNWTALIQQALSPSTAIGNTDPGAAVLQEYTQGGGSGYDTSCKCYPDYPQYNENGTIGGQFADPPYRQTPGPDTPGNVGFRGPVGGGDPSNYYPISTIPPSGDPGPLPP